MRVNKFIIHNNELIFGHVEYHYQLMGNRDRQAKIGGGRWEYNPNDFGNKLFIFGRSADFGPVTINEFAAAWKIAKDRPAFKKFAGCEVCFSEFENFSDVLKQHNIAIP